MADKLKPCPFCGGEAEYSTIDSSYVIPFGTIHHFVTCKNNHCLEGLYSRGNTKEEAIEAWNNRPSPWHTGIPTEEGWYLLYTSIPNAPYHLAFYQFDHWFSDDEYCIIREDVIAWQKIELYKED